MRSCRRGAGHGPLSEQIGQPQHPEPIPSFSERFPSRHHLYLP
jgi:hypothetical protein